MRTLRTLDIFPIRGKRERESSAVIHQFRLPQPRMNFLNSELEDCDPLPTVVLGDRSSAAQLRRVAEELLSNPPVHAF